MLKVKKAWLLKNLPMSVVIEQEDGTLKQFNKLLGNVTEEDLRPYKSYYPDNIKGMHKRELMDSLYPVFNLEKMR